MKKFDGGFDGEALDINAMDFDMNIFNHLPESPLPKDFHDNLHEKLLLAKNECYPELDINKEINEEFNEENDVAEKTVTRKFWQKTWFPRVAVAAICLCTGLSVYSNMDFVNKPAVVSDMPAGVRMADTDTAMPEAAMPMMADDATPEMASENSKIDDMPMVYITEMVAQNPAHNLDIENTKKIGDMLAEVLE